MCYTSIHSTVHLNLYWLLIIVHDCYKKWYNKFFYIETFFYTYALHYFVNFLQAMWQIINSNLLIKLTLSYPGLIVQLVIFGEYWITEVFITENQQCPQSRDLQQQQQQQMFLLHAKNANKRPR